MLFGKDSYSSHNPYGGYAVASGKKPAADICGFRYFCTAKNMKQKEKTSGYLLGKIDNPKDLKGLDQAQLEQLAGELREFILDVISVHPGHLGSSLGVVELTLALHYVFNTPHDKLIWDVGHQAYAHKIITGRRDVFHSLRQLGGISGFPTLEESVYDTFGTGHASTSISAALGMAEASALKGEHDKQFIAVIGDGALTGGMAMEALNNAGASNANIIVILNDNGIAIDQNRGALKNYLGKITAPEQDNNPPVDGNNSVSRTSNLFEGFNFRYFGPVDGHNIPLLIRLLNQIKKIKGPRLLHIVTTKGKGFEQAEKEQTLFHAPGKFNRKTGAIEKKPLKHTYQEVYGKTLAELAGNNANIVAVTPAMPSGSALTHMIDKMPERVFDVGIAEQHAVTFSAGLALEGMKPFCTVYSSFLQRAYDQIIHDVALQKLPVVFGIDRAGLVGADGATHHGFFDLAFLNTIPNMVVAAPLNELELRNLMYTATLYNQGPFAIRYPRSEGVLESWNFPVEGIEIGKGRKLIQGDGEIAILALGHAGNLALSAIKKLTENDSYPSFYDMRFLKPWDEALLHEAMSNHSRIITVEDGILEGGFGMKTAAFAQRYYPNVKVTPLGIPDRFVPHGSLQELYRLCGFDTESIVNRLIEKV